MELLRRVIAPICNGLPRLLATTSTPHLTRPISFLAARSFDWTRPTQLLAPAIALVTPCRGFKVVNKLKKRCKDCYHVVRHQRGYIICKTKPRHKQMAMKKAERNTWILTHATQGPIRPW